MASQTQSGISDGRSERVLNAAIRWPEVERQLDEVGYALAPPVLSAEQCDELIALYDRDERFRRTIRMEQYRFGVGEYKYLAAPLPALVSRLRSFFYRGLAPIADRWEELRGSRVRYPAELERMLDRCHQAGQSRPTPLLLRYRSGGYNCLHQDLYGEVAFPLQVTVMLSRPEDFSGGEFLLLEQRPRAQSRGEAIGLARGAAIVFPTRWRPVAGQRGHYRVGVRHGVSRVRSGERFTLGLIFHDAQ